MTHSPPASARRAHRMPFGAELRADGSVRFRLWAPSHDRIGLALLAGTEPPLAMRRQDGGWHALATRQAGAGARYRFVLPDGSRVPDPASRHQPQGVHGPSEVVDPAAHAWTDTGWTGRPWHEAVLYELHIGAFTPEGTFRAAIGRLDHLVALGVTAIELMPVAAFPGTRSWGYDGVLPFAPHATYGRPEALKELVAAAHARGLMVLLDVVYNHVGPEGNCLHAIAPEAFATRHRTPWGAAPNFDGAGSAVVRDFFIHNALYWIGEFHLDGLRLDAVHAIADDSARHILDELAERVRAATHGRHVHLVLENDRNEARRLRRDHDGRPASFTAQWNDDVHHALHVAASGESGGHYAGYKGDTEKLGRALAEGFAVQGEHMHHRGRARGEPSTGLPPTAFVAFIQNHDQVGNRALGDRLTAYAPPDAVRAVAATCLLLPQVPMLFMGEEWAALQPFPFFCDLGPELADAVRDGRRREFALSPGFSDPGLRARIPDPLSAATFASATLHWDDVARAPHAAWLDWYRRILALRHAEIVPRLPGMRRGGHYAVLGESAVSARWEFGAGALLLHANLSAVPVRGTPPAGRVLWHEGGVAAEGVLAPWSVAWSIEETQA